MYKKSLYKKEIETLRCIARESPEVVSWPHVRGGRDKNLKYKSL